MFGPYFDGLYAQMKASEGLSRALDYRQMIDGMLERGAMDPAAHAERAAETDRNIAAWCDQHRMA